MKYNYKTMIVPIVAAVFMGIELVTKHPVDESTKQMWTDIAVAVVTTAATVIGIIHSHDKPKKGDK